MSQNLGYAAAAEWPLGTLLNKGKAVGTPSIPSGSAYTVDVVTGGWDQLSVSAIMTGAANGDMTASVFPVYADGTVGTVSIAPLSVTGPTFAGSTVQYTANYDVSGYDKVRVAIKNNNASAQTLQEFSWHVS